MNAIDQRVGRRLRDRRLLLGLSQEQLADKLGLSFQQVQKYEYGTNRIAASTLFRLAIVLDAPVGYFFDDDGVVPRSPGVSEREVLELIRRFNSIRDAQTRAQIRRVVNDIAGPESASDGAATGDIEATEAGELRVD